MAWYDLLLPASFRGVPFGVRGSEYGGGRRTAIHSYPFRDGVWVEDLGKLERRVTFSGFMVGDGCYARAKLLLLACEMAGPGTLVHPSLGITRVALISPVRMVERAEKGGMVELQFDVAETLNPSFPSAITNTIRSVLSAVDRALGAVGDSYFASILGASVLGIGLVGSVSAAVSGWVGLVKAVADDPDLTTHAVTGLRPAYGTYGRYANGGRDSNRRALSTQDALDAAVTARTGVLDAAARMGVAAAAGDSLGLSRSAFVVVEALRSACADPADAIRLLNGLPGYTITAASTGAPLGQAIVAAQTATATLCRQMALCALAQACTDYRPASYDDATTLQGRVVALFEAEEARVGPASADGLYQALSQLRTAVVDDLQTRAALLPRLRTVRTPQAQSSLVLAYRLYADSGRADEMVRRAHPQHPGFMPTEFQALTE